MHGDRSSGGDNRRCGSAIVGATVDPFRKYTPKRSDNNDGTITDILDEATAVTIYGVALVHDSEIKFMTNKHEDVFPGNILVPLSDESAAQYRVTGSLGVEHGSLRTHSLERISKPVRPLAGGFDSGFDSGFE